jgi:hypothetical protein
LFNGGDSRIPVDLCLAAPGRETVGNCVAVYGRRPVVAVLDTGVRTHQWLEVYQDPAAPGGYAATEPDGFVIVSHPMQDIIYQQGLSSAGLGDGPRQLIENPWDGPVSGAPLVGELDTHLGHGSFIAGIVRQVVPDASVLSLRIMHSDGIVYEGDLTCALALLADQVAAALTGGDLTGMVDVVSLSLGYFSESPADVTYSSWLREVIDQLLSMGVAVVAAAGNYATKRRFYPAAFSVAPAPADQIPVISVGARNPNGSQALFSDAGPWVTGWAPGAVLISTFPQDVNAARMPEVELDADRESLDPDDFSGGFAAWSGTSFSAPLLGAHLASSMLNAAGVTGSPLRLDGGGAQAAVSRAKAALVTLGWQG